MNIKFAMFFWKTISSPDIILPRPLFTFLDTGADIIFTPLRTGSETEYSYSPPKHFDVAT